MDNRLPLDVTQKETWDASSNVLCPFPTGKGSARKIRRTDLVDSSILGRKIYCFAPFPVQYAPLLPGDAVVRFVNGRCHLDDTQKNCSLI